MDDNFDRMEPFARLMPMTRATRPAWEIETLMNLGLSVESDTCIRERVWSYQEIVNSASTPMFLLCGEKRSKYQMSNILF